MIEIATRFHELLIKLVSVKGMVFFIGTWMLWTGRIDATVWWLTAAVVIGGRALEKATAK
jgi:hypothetical protein